MNKLIWLHDEMLRIQHPIFEGRDDNTHVFYVWDNEYIKSAALNSKRLVFIYETLCELPITIYKGNTREVINHLCHKHENNVVFTPSVKSTALKMLVNSLESVIQIKTIDDIQLFDYQHTKDHARFFQFWKSIKKTQYLQDVLKGETDV